MAASNPTFKGGNAELIPFDSIRRDSDGKAYIEPVEETIHQESSSEDTDGLNFDADVRALAELERGRIDRAVAIEKTHDLQLKTRALILQGRGEVEAAVELMKTHPILRLGDVKRGLDVVGIIFNKVHIHYGEEMIPLEDFDMDLVDRRIIKSR